MANKSEVHQHGLNSIFPISVECIGHSHKVTIRRAGCQLCKNQQLIVSQKLRQQIKFAPLRYKGLLLAAQHDPCYYT